MSEAEVQQLRRLLARLVGVDADCWQIDRTVDAVLAVAPEFYAVIIAGHGEVCQPFYKHAPTEHVRVTVSKSGGRTGGRGDGRI